MGGEQFFDEARGKTADEAFKAAVSEAQYDYGHTGYTGTIAEKCEFKTFTCPDVVDIKTFIRWCNGYPEVDLDDIPQEHHEVVTACREVADGSKWGPAACVQDPDDHERWFFFGWASA